MARSLQRSKDPRFERRPGRLLVLGREDPRENAVARISKYVDLEKDIAKNIVKGGKRKAVRSTYVPVPVELPIETRDRYYCST